MTTGAERAGLQVVLAVNHWRTAIYSHQQNHPTVRHICARIEHIDARQDATLPAFDVLMAAPECTHHSIARGGRPVNDQSRQQPFALIDWIDAKRPRWVVVENVREFRDWGPVVNAGTERKPAWKPDPARKGETFRAWLAAITACGYQVDVQLLNAADFGAATKRIRLFVIARRGRSRKAIPWPEPTHNKEHWQPAYSIIDWSRPCPSIFGRKRPLADKTLKRIEIGLRKFVGAAADPFIVHLRGTSNTADLAQPAPTITASGGHLGLVQPFLVQFHNGPDGDRRTYDLRNPLPTLDTQPRYAMAAPFFLPRQGYYDCHRDKPAKSLEDPLGVVTANHGPGTLCIPFLMDVHDRRSDDKTTSAADPMPTIVTKPGNSLVMPFLLDTNHGDDAHTGGRVHSPLDPLKTITAGANGKALCLPFLTKYYGTGGVQPVTEPIDTITTRDRYGLAMASLIETMRELRVVDIGFRMLGVDELAAAQGFPPNYYLHGTKAEQVKQVGNAVCPPVAEAICRAIAA